MTALLPLFLLASLATHVAARVWVPSGQFLQPSGTVVTFAGRPTDVCAASTTTLAVKTSFSLLIFDRASLRQTARLPVPNPGFDFPRQLGSGGTYGMYCDPHTGRVWVTDSYQWLRAAARDAHGRWRWTRSIRLPGSFPAPMGVTPTRDPNKLYVALSRSNSIAVIDVRTGRRTASYPTGIAPYAVLPIGSDLYVSNWGGDPPTAKNATAQSSGSAVRVDARGIANSGSVWVIDALRRRSTVRIRAGLHSSALALTPNGRTVFVAGANDDDIAAIDTRSKRLVRVTSLSSDGMRGRAPNALAVSPDGKRLYVALGGENRVVEFDARTGARLATFRTGWYPSAIFPEPGKTFEVADLKGAGDHVPVQRGGYSAYDLRGALQRITESQRAPQPAYAAYTRRSLPPFKHVIYMVKENHTYDDFLGDLGIGDGDPRLCVFPERVSPNHHALAREFGVFDRFFVNSVVSADGHNWIDEDDATDYIERSMAGFPRSYPSSGDDPLAYAATGFIWTHVMSAGLSFMDYGEFFPDTGAMLPKSATWSSMYALYRANKPLPIPQNVRVQSLRGHVRAGYPSFALEIPDQYRASVFIGDLKRYERDGNLPSLVMLDLPDDHTADGSAGFPSPRAEVADNDLALGRVVEAVSESRFWKDTVIFVIEDDAQNGLDHVDGQRTTAFVISAYNRPHVVDSTHYNQSSIMRTIDDIFGLQPLTLFDAIAVPIVAPFGQSPVHAPYTARAANIPLDEPPKTTSWIPRNFLDSPDQIFMAPVYGASRSD